MSEPEFYFTKDYDTWKLNILSEGANMATKVKAKDNKTSRFGMRVAPKTKKIWEATAKSWGYKSTSEWLEAMANWAIQYENFEGSYEEYLKKVASGKN